MLDQLRIRLGAINYVRQLRDRWPGAIPASELRRFGSGEETVFLKGQQGVFKPKELNEPLSIRTALDSPYNDEFFDGTKVIYNFAPPSREHENDGLKRAAEQMLPLIYLVQVHPKPKTEYMVFAPVFVVKWDNALRTFFIDLAEQDNVVPASSIPSLIEADEVHEMSKKYIVTAVERRMHQARFRNEVLAAYRERCAVCVLRIRPLLDAAHVIPDRDPKPTLIVNEGLSLCSIHHRAFDARIIRYDRKFTMRVELPEGAKPGEAEKTMLLAFDGRPLTLPSDRKFWPVVI